MNFGTIDVVVASHIDGVRRQAAAGRVTASGRELRAAPGAAGRPGLRLRSRIGFALVEAGLHLQANGRPVGGTRPRAAE
jgi:hypothetical protein